MLKRGLLLGCVPETVYVGGTSIPSSTVLVVVVVVLLLLLLLLLLRLGKTAKELRSVRDKPSQAPQEARRGVVELAGTLGAEAELEVSKTGRNRNIIVNFKYSYKNQNGSKCYCYGCY